MEDERKSIRPGGRLAAQAAGQNIAAIYSSHPIARLKIGPYQFERGVLKLNREDAAAFDEVLAEQPAPIRNGVKKSTSASRLRSCRVARRRGSTPRPIQSLPAARARP
jgi:hypothetical protein